MWSKQGFNRNLHHSNYCPLISPPSLPHSSQPLLWFSSLQLPHPPSPLQLSPPPHKTGGNRKMATISQQMMITSNKMVNWPLLIFWPVYIYVRLVVKVRLEEIFASFYFNHWSLYFSTSSAKLVLLRNVEDEKEIVAEFSSSSFPSKLQFPSSYIKGNSQILLIPFLIFIDT